MMQMAWLLARHKGGPSTGTSGSMRSGTGRRFRGEMSSGWGTALNAGRHTSRCLHWVMAGAQEREMVWEHSLVCG